MEVSREELGRRTVHILGIIYPLSYILTDNQVLTVYFLIISLIIGSVLEYSRLYRGFNNYIYQKLTREYEDEKLAGYYLYIVGLCFSWIFFDAEIALVSSFVLAISDPIGGILNDEEEAKPKIAIFGVFISSSLISSLILVNFQVNALLLALQIICCGCTASFADAYKVKIGKRIVDDNILIPVLCGFVLTVVKYSYLILL